MQETSENNVCVYVKEILKIMVQCGACRSIGDSRVLEMTKASEAGAMLRGTNTVL